MEDVVITGHVITGQRVSVIPGMEMHWDLGANINRGFPLDYVCIWLWCRRYVRTLIVDCRFKKRAKDHDDDRATEERRLLRSSSWLGKAGVVDHT